MSGSSKLQAPSSQLQLPAPSSQLELSALALALALACGPSGPMRFPRVCACSISLATD